MPPGRAEEKAALSQAEITRRLAELPQWRREGQGILRVHTFREYKDALDFVYQVGLAAEENDHHPDIVMNFKQVQVHYWTHSASGVSALDFRMAGLVEQLVRRFDPREPGARA